MSSARVSSSGTFVPFTLALLCSSCMFSGATGPPKFLATSLHACHALRPRRTLRSLTSNGSFVSASETPNPIAARSFNIDEAVLSFGETLPLRPA